MRLLVLNLLLVSTCFAESSRGVDALSPLNSAFQKAADGASFHRYVEGPIDMVFGAFTGLGGFDVAFIDTTRPMDEVLVGLATSILGGVEFVDGVINTFAPSYSQILNAHMQNFPSTGKPAEDGGLVDKKEWGERTLKRLSDDGRHMRYFRALVTGLSSASCFYFASKGDSVLVPGILFGAFTLYRVFFKSADEIAWDEYQSGIKSKSSLDVHLFATAIPKGALFGATLRF